MACVLSFYTKHIGIYPNPSQDFIYLEGDNLNVEEVFIYDMEGRMIKSNVSYEGNIPQVEVSTLPSGKYILSTGDNTTLFIKE